MQLKKEKTPSPIRTFLPSRVLQSTVVSSLYIECHSTSFDSSCTLSLIQLASTVSTRIDFTMAPHTVKWGIMATGWIAESKPSFTTGKKTLAIDD